MAAILALASRSGVITEQYAIGAQNTQLDVSMEFGAIPAGLDLKFTLEQRQPGNDWSVVGIVHVPDLAEIGLSALAWKISEQIVADVDGWESHRDVQKGAVAYHQLDLRPVQRITVETSAALEYSVDIVASDVAP